MHRGITKSCGLNKVGRLRLVPNYSILSSCSNIKGGQNVFCQIPYIFGCVLVRLTTQHRVSASWQMALANLTKPPREQPKSCVV